MARRFTNRAKDPLKEYQSVVAKLKLDFGVLLDELRKLDPAGWSVWYDENVPDWNNWLSCGPAMTVIGKRIRELKELHKDTVIPKAEIV
jgi:hypothetical protein